MSWDTSADLTNRSKIKALQGQVGPVSFWVANVLCYCPMWPCRGWKLEACPLPSQEFMTGSLPKTLAWGPADLHCFRDRATQPARQIARVPSIASRYLLGYTGKHWGCFDSNRFGWVLFEKSGSTIWAPLGTFLFQDMGLCCWYVVLLGLFKKSVLFCMVTSIQKCKTCKPFLHRSIVSLLVYQATFSPGAHATWPYSHT